MTQFKSRGDRNNNPLNIKKSTIHWNNEIDSKSENVFEVFKTPYDGYIAGLKLLYHHYHGGCYTLSTLISKWAPKAENQTDVYINFVSQSTHLAPNTPFSFSIVNIGNIVNAMARFENGYIPNSRTFLIALEDFFNSLEFDKEIHS